MEFDAFRRTPAPAAMCVATPGSLPAGVSLCRRNSFVVPMSAAYLGEAYGRERWGVDAGVGRAAVTYGGGVGVGVARTAEVVVQCGQVPYARVEEEGRGVGLGAGRGQRAGRRTALMRGAACVRGAVRRACGVRHVHAERERERDHEGTRPLLAHDGAVDLGELVLVVAELQPLLHHVHRRHDEVVRHLS